MEECKKLKTIKNKVGLKNCFRFNELILLKCPLKKALNFSKKQFCRYDTTKRKDGPIGFRKLKVHKSSLPRKMNKGWTTNSPEITNKYHLKNLKSKKELNTIMKNYLVEQNKSAKKRVKTLEKKIYAVSKFYNGLNKKYSFKKMDKKQLYSKLKKMNSQNKEENSKIVFSPLVDEKAKEIFGNLERYKSNFEEKVRYQKSMRILAKKKLSPDYYQKGDKEMLDRLKGDREVVRELNNTNYKFPVFDLSPRGGLKKKSKRKLNQFLITFNSRKSQPLLSFN